MGKFPARPLFLLLLALMSSASCHKRDCVVMVPNHPLERMVFDKTSPLLILGSISLDQDNCYSASVRDLKTGLYVLGIYATPLADGWKPNSSWNKFKMKMTVRDSQGNKLIDSRFNLLRLYECAFRQTSTNNYEPIFLGHGEFYPQVGREPYFNWKTTSMTTRISAEPPINEEEDYFREYPVSWFNASKDDTYDIRIEIKGGCPESFNPDVKIGLLKLN